ncbi:unnamed protein product [Urochloa humidicola]
MAPNSNSSKLVRSLSIIVLLVAVALALAPIVTGSSVAHHSPTGGGSHDPNSPPCSSCSYAGACPWCH